MIGYVCKSIIAGILFILALEVLDKSLVETGTTLKRFIKMSTNEQKYYISKVSTWKLFAIIVLMLPALPFFVGYYFMRYRIDL